MTRFTSLLWCSLIVTSVSYAKLNTTQEMNSLRAY